MSVLLDIAKEIAKFSASKLARRLNRDYWAAKILQKTPFFELKDDFDSVYVHALVEYWINNKSEKLLRFFADDAVKEIFQRELYSPQFDTTKLADILHSIQHLGKDKLYLDEQQLSNELQEFQEKFREITNKSRSPKELESYKKLRFLEWREIERTFDYQMELYLHKVREEFQNAFLDHNYYVDLNGEIRRPKRLDVRLHRNPGEGLKKEDRYEITEFKPLDGYIRQWLDNDSANFLVILGEYGTGKTTFLRHLTHQLATGLLVPNSENLSVADKRARYPLFLPLRDFEKTMANFIISQMNENGITDLNYARFEQKLKDGELIVFLDGFDEMAQQRMDAEEKKRNFARIRQLIEVSDKTRIILTCREEFFRSDEEIAEVFRHQDRPNYSFVHLQPFSDDQIQQFLQTHTDDPDFFWRKIEDIFDLHDLAKRPVLLEFIVKYLPQLIAEKEPGEPIRAADLYQKCFDDELRRKAEQLTLELPGRYRLEILQKLAVWMFVNETLSYDVALQEPEVGLRQYFKVRTEWEFERKLNEFLTFTFLIREADNQFRISHKSFRDFLTAQAFVKEIDENNIEHFARKQITKEIAQFMSELQPNRTNLLDLALTAKNPPEQRQWQGSNAVTVLLKIDKDSFAGQDFSDCQLSHIDFTGANLRNTNFARTNLSHCVFDENIFSADVKDGDFSGSELVLSYKWLTSIPSLNEMKNLTSLNLSYNQITDVSPLAGLKNLTELILSGNRLADVSPLKNLTKLKRLRLIGNPLEEGQIEQLQKALPDTNISF